MYLVTDVVDGATWADAAINDSDKVSVIEKLTDAVEHLHGLGISHGDLHPGNVLTQNGRLAAVIDWGVAAIGDPAIDLMPTWSMFTGDARATFRKDIGADATAWLRASGWTLSVCVIALAYYRGKNAAIVAATRREITEVLGEI